MNAFSEEDNAPSDCGIAHVQFADSNRCIQTLIMPGEDTVRLQGTYWIDGSEFIWEFRTEVQDMPATLTVRNKFNLSDKGELSLRLNALSPEASYRMWLNRSALDTHSR